MTPRKIAHFQDWNDSRKASGILVSAVTMLADMVSIACTIKEIKEEHERQREMKICVTSQRLLSLHRKLNYQVGKVANKKYF